MTSNCCTPLRLLLSFDDELQRDFYIEICSLEKWSVRQLQDRIRSMLFERTAISRKPEDTIKNDLALLRDEGKLSQNLVFRDPYVLDFLGLSDSYLEKDLESSIVAELQKFISELGSDFAFMARQKRITIDDIQKATSEHFGLKQVDLISERRNRSIARPRQAAMWLAKQLTTRSLPDIGRRFGGRDHTTVLHAVRRIEALRAEDPQLARDLETLTRKLRG